MTEFSGYTCWSTESVLKTIATEAVSPSDSVFLATHAPLDVRRLTPGNSTPPDRTLIDESALLKEFLTRPTNNGVLVIPVLGASGAGKSHLVRWVHTQMPDDPARRIIYLPKESTSLAGVVDKLLLDLNGELFDKIRNDVARLGRDVTQESLERRLLDELAESLRVAPHRNPMERALVGEKGLYLLLHDPFFRSQLLQRHSLVPRRAAHAIHGRAEDEPDVPLQFTVDDLPSDVLDVRAAAHSSQQLFRALVANDPLKQQAVDLLNQHLDVAVMQAANIGVGRLQKAFLGIRRALAERKQEIILLVEDFALVQGVQRDLLEAILETGERDGSTVLAPIRTLLAVTTGYYESLAETLRTRIESSSPVRYEMRVSLAGPETRADTEQRIVDFVGRYLNAARLGRDRLDAARVTDGSQAPNMCDDCMFKDPCHSGFGTATTGHGLYPYNQQALLRAVRSATPNSQAAKGDDPDTFNPRVTLARVVRHALIEYHGDIKRRAFPNQSFAADFPPRRDERILSPAVEVEARQTPEGERRQVLLAFWAGAPSFLVNLAPQIHTAFGIPQVSADSLPPPESVKADPDSGPASQPERRDGIPPRVRLRLDRIANWNGRNDDLHQDVANEIRKSIHAAVLSRVLWTDPPMREATQAAITKAWSVSARSISIEGANENIARTVTPTIRLGRNPENARFFEEIVKLREGVPGGALHARVRLDRMAEEHAPVVEALVLQQMERTDAHLVEALRVSIVGAVLLGYIAPRAKPAELLDAALTEHLPTRADMPLRAHNWHEFETRHREARPALVEEIRNSLGAAQGAGAVLTIDAARALPLVKAAAFDAPIDLTSGLPQWAKPAAKTLSAVKHLVDQQVSELTDVVQQCRSRLPRGTGFSETVRAVEQAIDAGEHHGYVRVTDVPGLKERNRRAAEAGSSRDLDRLEADLSTLTPASSFAERLAVAARDRGNGLSLMKQFLRENDTWLDDGLAGSVGAVGSDVSGLLKRLDAVLQEWSDLTGQEGS